MQRLEQQSPKEQQRQQAEWEKQQQEYEQRRQQQQQQMQQSLFTMVEMGPYEVMFLNQHVASRLLDAFGSWGSEGEEEHIAQGRCLLVRTLMLGLLLCLGLIGVEGWSAA
jgi:hypothetical protein